MNLSTMTDLERMSLFATQVSVYGIHTKTHGLVRNKSIYMGLVRLKPNAKLGGMTRAQFAKVSVFDNAGAVQKVNGLSGHRSGNIKRRYKYFSLSGTTYKAADINIWMLTGLNVGGTDYVVDHIDGDYSNDSLGNLRIVHTSVNSTLIPQGSPRLLANGKYSVSISLSMFGIFRVEVIVDSIAEGEILLRAVRLAAGYPINPEMLPSYLRRLRKPASNALGNILVVAGRLSHGSLDKLWKTQGGKFKSSVCGKAMKKYM